MNVIDLKDLVRVEKRVVWEAYPIVRVLREQRKEREERESEALELWESYLEEDE
jgi:hypothetical protein